MIVRNSRVIHTRSQPAASRPAAAPWVTLVCREAVQLRGVSPRSSWAKGCPAPNVAGVSCTSL